MRPSTSSSPVAGPTSTSGEVRCSTSTATTPISRATTTSASRSPKASLPLRDPRATQSLDSFAFLFEPVSWAGVPAGMPRTWVRCLRDQLQSRDVQDRLIAACAATDVREIDTGHTPARDDPAALAAMLDEIAAESLG